MAPRRPTHPPSDAEPTGFDRLQKVLAAAGIGSRRECEALITAGRVEVDGEFVTELGRKVDPTKNKIQVDGVALAKPRRVYFALNKPVGVVSTNSDPDGRPRVIDLINSSERLYPVGRLDRTSEGLILVTNDGELANRLTHPRYGVEKVYRVRVVGKPTAAELAKVRKGVYLSEGLARVSSIQTKRRFKQSTELEIVLQEGLNREIRRILARVGHKVVQLKRVAIGPIRLGTMPVGAHRMLSREEVQALRKATKRRKKPEAGAAAKQKSAGQKSTGQKSAGQTSASDGVGSDAAKPRRRKTGSSALSGYSRPTKKGVRRTKSSSGRAAAGPQGEASSASKSKSKSKTKTKSKLVRSGNETTRPKKKGAKSVTAGKARATRKKPTSRPGKAAGQAGKKKKTSRKRRR